jgi:hypothetical protein
MPMSAHGASQTHHSSWHAGNVHLYPAADRIRLRRSDLHHENIVTEDNPITAVENGFDDVVEVRSLGGLDPSSDHLGVTRAGRRSYRLDENVDLHEDRVVYPPTVFHSFACNQPNEAFVSGRFAVFEALDLSPKRASLRSSFPARRARDREFDGSTVVLGRRRSGRRGREKSRHASSYQCGPRGADGGGLASQPECRPVRLSKASLTSDW